jgi:type I restriction enzyme, S subunit
MAMISVVNFSDISKRLLLRFGSRYVDFWKNQNGRIFQNKLKTIKLKYLVKFSSAKVIKKNSVDGLYQLIDLANIEPGTGFPINLENNIVDNIGSDKVYLSDADLVFSKLNSHIGYVFLLNDIPQDEYEIIGSTEFYPLNVDSTKINTKFLKYILLHNDFRKKALFLRSGKSQSHPRIQKDDFLNLEIPNIDYSKQERIVQKIDELEKNISIFRNKVESLQKIIDVVYTKYKLKTVSINFFRTEKFNTNLKYISQNKALRIGAEYNHFWLTHNGHLFEGTSNVYEIIPLKRLIKLSDKSTLKKGILSEPRILIDFEQIEALYSIINIDNIVSEIGSDKVEFGNCDFVTNKLDPYSGYTFINKPELNMIGTTELWPMEVIDKTKTHVHYIHYLLLSTEYLEKSKLLMSGKRHPRIHHLDLLNIKVPFPKYEIQENIVKEIQEREIKSEKARVKIRTLRKQIDDLISEELSKIENHKGNITIGST